MTLLTRAFAGIALILFLAACQSASTAKRSEFEDAEAILAPEDVVSIDEALSSEPVEIPPAVANTSWPQTDGGPQHAPIHVAAPDLVERVWRTRIIGGKAKGAPITTPPVIDEERIYFIDAIAGVRALDKATGREVWEADLMPDVRDPNVARWNIFARIKPKDLGFGGGAAVSNGRLFVTSGFGFVAALDAATGEVLWTTETTSPMRNPPTAVNDLVIGVSITNEVLALDQATGEEVWSYASFEESARFVASAAPGVFEDSVIVPFSSGEVISLNVETGRVQWTVVVSRTSRLNALSAFGDIAGSPVTDRGAAFIVSQSGQMVGIDLRTGNTAWEQPVGGQHTPWLAGETLYVVSNRGALAAVNRIDGRIRWSTTLPEWTKPKARKGRIQWAGPVLAGGKLYLTGTHGKMIAVSPQNGEIYNEYKLKSGTTQPPIVADGTIFVLTGKGDLEAFR